MEIKKVAILGSGIMGSGIASHLANAGIPSLLLDIVPPSLSEDDKKAGLTIDSKLFRNKFSLKALNENLPKQKPSPLFESSVLKLITPGNFEDDFDKIADCDWVIEVVVERLDIKKQVYEKLEKILTPQLIVSSNTSGIPLSALTEGRSDSFKSRFLITHFFNPVRYMKLVEVVAGQNTDPQTVKFMSEFLSQKMGKGVVYAKDTPSFIGNRIGVYAILNAVKHTLDFNLSVEAVDKIMGSATGKPNSAVFRTLDIVGLDTILHVAKNNHELLLNDEKREELLPSPVMKTLEQNKWLGDKTGQGFYKKVKNKDGKKEILSIDLKTMEYAMPEKVRFDCLGVAKNIDDVRERLKSVLMAEDVAGQFAWATTRDTLIYAVHRLGEIADDIVNIDNAMKWGFNWDLGPFEMLDAYGVPNFIDRATLDKKEVPAILKTVAQSASASFYRWHKGQEQYFDYQKKDYQNMPRASSALFLKDLKQQNKILASNAGATLYDLGDGVVNVEFHTKMNAIDSDIGQMMQEALDWATSHSECQGIVIANEAAQFSVGANLMLLWMEANQQNWSGIEALIKGFQDVCLKLRTFPKPVVVATAGLTLGGGCEVSMAADAVRALGETYIGLVEVGAGLIPAGGGCKNLLLNLEVQALAQGLKGWAGPSDGGPFPKVKRAFELIGFAKVAQSAKEALTLGYLPHGRTQISMNKESLIFDAKSDVLRLAKDYKAYVPSQKISLPGVGGRLALEVAISDFELKKDISAHDALIARKLAYVLTGGALPTMGFVTEQELLDLEREQFLSLCGEPLTQARMQHLILKGKPLRN